MGEKYQIICEDIPPAQNDRLSWQAQMGIKKKFRDGVVRDAQAYASYRKTRGRGPIEKAKMTLTFKKAKGLPWDSGNLPGHGKWLIDGVVWRVSGGVWVPDVLRDRVCGVALGSTPHRGGV